MTVPRGIQCNNPLNLMHVPSIKWQGETPTTDPEGRLCTFDTIVDGIRAGVITLLSYYKHDGCDTVTKIINRFAPPTVDNNQTQAYIDFICKGLAVGPTDALVMTCAPFLDQWVILQAHFEQGGDFCTPEQIQSGVTEALAHR